MKNSLGIYSFVIGMVIVFLFAAYFPQWGDPHGVLPTQLLGHLGVFVIFFNQGVSLAREELRRGFLEWKLHILVQITTYIVFPILIGLGLWVSSAWFDQVDLRRGFLYLGFVPTTVASAMALSLVAKGNVSGSLFNCTLSSILAVIFIPLLGMIFLGASGADNQVTLGGILSKIAMNILLPLILGQIFRHWLKNTYAEHKMAVKSINNGVILFIVWSAFCQSFLRDVWQRVSGMDLIITCSGALVLFAAASAWLWSSSSWLGLSRESRITAFYCGGQKSVAMGLPLSAMIVGSNSSNIDLSLFLLPLLIYHTAQLMIGGWMVPYFQKFSSHPQSESLSV